MAGPEDYSVTAAQVAAANKKKAAAAVAPTSGAVPNFTPTVKMPEPATAPGNTGFVGPVPVVPNTPDYGAIPYGTPVPGFTPEVPYPTQTAKPGSTNFVGPVSVPQVTNPASSGPDYTDAFAILADQLRQWGLGTLADSFVSLAKSGMTPNEAMNKVKFDKTVNPATGKAWNADYTLRFAGNATRVANGLNALSEGQYILNENAYAETLKAYGLNNMLSTDRAANEAKFATYIGNDLSPTEFKDRIDLAATRVINMDPAIQQNFQQYYPDVTKSDLISYFLAPDETLPLLKTKVNAAEIGAAAGYQGLGIGVNRAEELAKFGETYAQAQTDYSKIAEVLPTANKLSSIYGEEGIAYGQNVAEDEFIKQDAAAKLKRNRLASKERAMFGGDSGLSSQFSSLGSSIQGKF